MFSGVNAWFQYMMLFSENSLFCIMSTRHQSLIQSNENEWKKEEEQMSYLLDMFQWGPCPSDTRSAPEMHRRSCHQVFQYSTRTDVRQAHCWLTLVASFYETSSLSCLLIIFSVEFVFCKLNLFSKRLVSLSLSKLLHYIGA